MKIFTTRVKSKISKFVMKTGVLLIWLLIWQLVYLFVDQELLISSPINIFMRIVELSFTTLFWKSIGISFMRIFIGLILALVSGTILAVITTKFKILDYFFKPVLNIIKSTPVASFIILALIWLKSYRISAFIAFLMVLPMVWENVSEGIKNTDIKLLEMTKVFNIPKRRVLKAVYIPSIMPYFAAACNVGIGFAWKAGIAAEVIGLSKGTIGRNLYNAKIYLETVDIFAWTVVVIILSLLFEKGFVKVINFFFKKAGIMYDYL
ncbi:ABC transporter permease [Clostridium sp.]|uniref:ABC transporter permease n=1 Tax=Clostridium sp. TaxID=1506 RepID=UPI001A56C0B9|nr:ABC transporter permease subunit [Clostridium sp.]MBK5242291.1 ABC transporter permease subunit [Clostridium sp.]